MADNVTLNAGSGGATMATDDDGTAQHQYVKLEFGGDGTFTKVSTASPLPISDAGGSVTVDGTVAVSGTVTVDTELPAAAALADNAANPTAPAVGAFGMCWDGSTWDRMPGTSADGVLVNLGANNDVACSQSGTWNITNVSGTVSLPTGASTAANQSTANTALAAIQTAVEALDNAVSGNELQIDVVGALPAGTNNIGDVDVLSVVPGTAATSLGKAEDAAHTTADTGVLMLGVRRDTAAVGSDTDGDYSTLNVDANGRLHVNGSGVTQPVSGTVTANLSATDNAVLDAIQAAVELIDNAISGSEIQADIVAALPAGANLIGSVTATGAAAHGAAVSGNPVLVGLEGRSTAPTAVDDGDTVRPLGTLSGKQVTQPYALPAQTWSYAAASGGITNTTGVTAKAAGGAGVRNYITHVSVSNGHATVGTDVQIRDGASGTVLWRSYAVAAGGGISEKFDPPLRGTADTLVEIANGTTGSATYFNLQGYTAAE